MPQDLISEVLEYSILYTSNITQKLKKWNDGSLKWYKFNSKVMIYNIDGILVSDSFISNHSRLVDETTWGREFMMGGLLVTIDSLISISTRDLINLFNKQVVKSDLVIQELRTSIHRNNTAALLNASHSPPMRRRVGLSRRLIPSRRTLKEIINSSSIRRELSFRKETPYQLKMIPNPMIRHFEASQQPTRGIVTPIQKHLPSPFKPRSSSSSSSSIGHSQRKQHPSGTPPTPISAADHVTWDDGPKNGNLAKMMSSALTPIRTRIRIKKSVRERIGIDMSSLNDDDVRHPISAIKDHQVRPHNDYASEKN